MEDRYDYLHGETSKAALQVQLCVDIHRLHSVKLLIHDDQIAICDRSWRRTKGLILVQDHISGFLWQVVFTVLTSVQSSPLFKE